MDVGGVVSHVQPLAVVCHVTYSLEAVHLVCAELVAVEVVLLDASVLVVYRGVDVCSVSNDSHARLRTEERTYILWASLFCGNGTLCDVSLYHLRLLCRIVPTE